MFGFFKKPEKETGENQVESTGAADEACDIQDYSMRGFAATTKIATEFGWRRITNVLVGERVHTFDNGLQTVVAVTRSTHFVAGDSLPDFTNPIHVPAGAIGNDEPIVLLPEQIVMLESDIAEELAGDPFALLPAKALIGFRGIERFRSLHPIEMITLHFENDEIVYADGGALMLTPSAVEGLALFDILQTSALPAPYTVWRGERARTLIAAMAKEDALALGNAACAAAA